MNREAGKGSSPRPYSVDQKTFNDNWDKIFKKERDNTGVNINEYQDILSTEECMEDKIKDES
jgi:hypothetical protein